MSQNNEALIRRWYEEVWNEKRTETIYELLAPEGVSHLESGELVGPEQFHQYHLQLVAGFPDLRLSIEEIISRDHTAAIRWTVEGTHAGAALGLEPTGKTVRARGITWLHIRDGQIVEGWDAWNMGGLMMQLASQ